MGEAMILALSLPLLLAFGHWVYPCNIHNVGDMNGNKQVCMPVQRRGESTVKFRWITLAELQKEVFDDSAYLDLRDYEGRPIAYNTDGISYCDEMSDGTVACNNWFDPRNVSLSQALERPAVAAFVPADAGMGRCGMDEHWHAPADSPVDLEGVNGGPIDLGYRYIVGDSKCHRDSDDSVVTVLPVPRQPQPSPEASHQP
jgi:hypothetical protein